MATDLSQTTAIIAKAESFPGIRAGIARLADVLKGPSYQVVPEGEWSTSLSDDGPVTTWPPGAQSVMVLGLHHPFEERGLDWWDGGNTPGNRRLMEVSEGLKGWLLKEHGLDAQPLPYHVERGGLFLKDAAVLAGLGVIGRSNLLLNPEWGPRIRLRALLIEGELQPTESIGGFAPCDACEGFCQKACPQKAFPGGVYNRPRCIEQINGDAANKVPGGKTDKEGRPIPVIKYCRACELACPAGV